ncbi:MAG: Tetratricopeptide repeat [Pseudomonadota bacterium]
MAYVAPMILRAIPVLAALALLTAHVIAAPSKPAQTASVTVESLLTQARAATAKGEVELALRLAQSAIVADPARPTSYVALGDIHAAAGQPDYARNYYEAALEIDPQYPAALRAIAALDKTKPATTANAAP